MGRLALSRRNAKLRAQGFDFICGVAWRRAVATGSRAGGTAPEPELAVHHSGKFALLGRIGEFLPLLGW